MTGASFQEAAARRGGPSYEMKTAPIYTLVTYATSLAPSASRSGLFPLVESLEVSNPTTTVTDAHTVALRVSGRVVGDWVQVPALQPGEARRVETRNVAAQALKQLLQEQTSPALVPVQLFRGSACVAQGQTLLLGPRTWLNVREHRRLIAAFVNPDEREIVDLVAESLGLSAVRAGGDTDEGTGAEIVRRALATLYEYVRTRFDVRYREPRRLERDPRSGVTYQSIAELDEVLVDGRASGATCLDLSVFFAACVEHLNACLDQVSLSPWILFTGSSRAPTGHALVGCRFGGAGPLDLVEDVQAIRREVASGRLLVWETTGACAEPASVTAAFDDAVASARATVDAYDVHAVDIGTCRQSLSGTVMPLPEAPRPIVTRAFGRARRLQTEYGLPNVDATLVLYALTFESNTKLEAVLQAVGSSAQALRQVLAEHTLPRNGGDGAGTGTGGGGGTQTRNCRRLWENSFEIAHSMGRRSPRECDLLWAVAWSRSDKLRQMLTEVGLPPVVYERELSKVCPEPPLSETTQM